MNATGAKRGFTLIDLLVVIVIIAVFVGCIPSALNSSREAGRRASCINNQKMIALAFQNYASTYNNRFPASASVTTASDGRQTVGGWSYLVRLLPFMEYDPLYKTLPQNGDPEDSSNQAIVAAMNAQLGEFVCPSGPGRSAKQSAGITNYKAMVATTRDSLVMVVNPQATPPYGSMSASSTGVPLHPDGTIFPGIGLTAHEIVDGLSHTIFTSETIDEAASRWTVGKEVTLVGLPQKSSPTGTTPAAPVQLLSAARLRQNLGRKLGRYKSRSANILLL